MRLLRLSPEEVRKLIENYEKDCTAIKKNCLTYSWYMRGGASYNDILNMSSEERSILANLIDDNLETTKKSGLPFF